MSEGKETAHRVSDALFHLRRGLEPFVAARMRAVFGERWQHYVSRAAGPGAEGALDVYALLKTVLDRWREVFEAAFARAERHRARSFASLALEARNATAHLTSPLQDEDALRYLDAIHQLLKLVKAPEEEVAIVRRHYEAQRYPVREVPSQPSAAPPEAAAPHPEPGAELRPELRPWIEVALPHPDVLAHRFRESEFAADLAAVSMGRASEAYADAVSFYNMTFLTEGLRRVLRSALERLTGRGGDPVLGLQTAFGGGKTHTLLALWHLARAGDLRALPGLEPLLAEIDVGAWRPARLAVFVGTAKGPEQPLEQVRGTAIWTVWGHLAHSLAGEAGLALVREAEQTRSNPGSERLVQLLELAAPCVVLLDEVVAYARQLPDDRLEAFLSFVQSLTEAAKMVPGAMVVGSLPESAAEAGGERGRQVLVRLEKVFGRVQSPWLPASGDETYEIVRRRLFQPLDGEAERARDATIKAFHELYRKNPADFPLRVREARYLELMRLCYPIHPELFDRLAKDWAALEKFQRTRGVLRLLATVVGVLWQQRVPDPLITPARLELAHERIRAAVLDPLDRGFAAVLDAEVDGERALPRELERNPSRRIAKFRAATRVARALFVATAPRAGSPHPGIGLDELRLACAEPGDQLAIFGEALRELAERAAYLYEEAGQAWFSTRPTLNRLAEDRARALDAGEVDAAIVEMLRTEAQHRTGFARVFAAPDEPTGIDEAEEIGLVLLGPNFPHTGRRVDPSSATEVVAKTLEVCRKAQRRFRNTLLFAVPDEAELAKVREAMRRRLAWKCIVADERLCGELTRGQLADAEGKAAAAEAGAAQALRAAWCHLLYPVRDEETEPGKSFRLERLPVQVRERKSLVEAIWDKVTNEGIVKEQLGKETLRRLLQEFWPNERPHLTLAELYEWFASYANFPKLRDRRVLDEAIAKAAGDLDAPFGWAEAVGPEGGYRGLHFASITPRPLPGGLILVRPEIAREGSRPPTGTDDGRGRGNGEVPVNGEPPDDGVTPRPAQRPRRFFGAVELDPTRPIRHLEQILEGVVGELRRTPDVRVTLVLEVQAESAAGFRPEDVGVVRDNAKQLKFKPESTEFSS